MRRKKTRSSEKRLISVLIQFKQNDRVIGEKFVALNPSGDNTISISVTGLDVRIDRMHLA